MEVLFFGQLTEITKTPSLQVNSGSDLIELKTYIFDKFPTLSNIHFMIAVDNKLVNDNIKLSDHSVIAFMPPYSGG